MQPGDYVDFYGEKVKLVAIHPRQAGSPEVELEDKEGDIIWDLLSQIEPWKEEQ